MKKGQVTIFIILGIVIALSAGIIYYNISNNSEFGLDKDDFTEIGNDKLMIKSYVESCLEDVGVLGLYLLANKGGQIYSYDNMLLTEFEEISYAVKYNQGAYSLPDELLSEYESEYGSLYKEDVSISEGKMLEEMNTFIENSVIYCIGKGNFVDVQLEFDDIHAYSEFNRKDVSISLDFPITIKSKDQETKMNDYKVTLPFRMRKIIDARDQIVKMILEDELYLEDLAQMDLEIDLIPYNGENVVYSIYDKQSGINDAPFIFKFAAHNKFDNKPTLDFIPDFVVDRNEIFNYPISTISDQKDLKFTSSNPSIMIGEYGLMEFLPTANGITNTTICAISSGGGKDCQIVRFKVV